MPHLIHHILNIEHQSDHSVEQGTHSDDDEGVAVDHVHIALNKVKGLSQLRVVSREVVVELPLDGALHPEACCDAEDHRQHGDQGKECGVGEGRGLSPQVAIRILADRDDDHLEYSDHPPLTTAQVILTETP